MSDFVTFLASGLARFTFLTVIWSLIWLTTTETVGVLLSVSVPGAGLFVAFPSVDFPNWFVLDLRVICFVGFVFVGSLLDPFHLPFGFRCYSDVFVKALFCVLLFP